MPHLYEAVNLPGIDNPPPLHLSVSDLQSSLSALFGGFEPFLGGGDRRLRPAGDAKRHFIGQGGRRANPLPRLQNLLWPDNKS